MEPRSHAGDPRNCRRARSAQRYWQLIEAARSYRTNHEARTASKPLGEAVALYLDSRADLRDSTQKSYKYTLEEVMAPLAKRMLADITTAEL